MLDKIASTANSVLEKAVFLSFITTSCGVLKLYKPGVLMLSIKSPIVPILFLAILFLTASSVSADPVTLGSLTFVPTSGTGFTLSGPGLAVNGTTATLNSSVSLLSNGLFLPGTNGSTGGSVDSQDGELFLTMPITAQGVSYNPGAYLIGLRFSSSSFMTPVQLASGFVVVAPFSLTAGLIEGYPNALGDVPIFSVPLTGQGTTILTFMLQPGNVYRLQSQTFLFGTTVQGTTVQSIPEPTSMLLIFSGMLALAGYRKRTIS